MFTKLIPDGVAAVPVSKCGLRQDLGSDVVVVPEDVVEVDKVTAQLHHDHDAADPVG